MNLYKVLNRLRNRMIQQRHHSFNVGAVIVSKNGTPLSWGFNSYLKTHPKMIFNKHYDIYKIFVHAECDAVYKLHKGDSAHTIIIARIGKSNQFLLSKPCLGCYYEIRSLGIKNIYYTNDDQELVLLNHEDYN